MILFRGFAMKALAREYWHEAVFTDDDVFILGPSDEAEEMNTVPGDQLMLMPLPEASKPHLSPRKKRTGHAAVPGTGPAGETCGTCDAYRSVRGGARAFPKCALMRAKWTAGPGSDIRKSDPACQRWEPQKETQS